MIFYKLALYLFLGIKTPFVNAVFKFESFNTIDGMEVVCASTITNTEYTQCNVHQVKNNGELYEFSNRRHCSNVMTSNLPPLEYTEMENYCFSLVGNYTTRVSYACTDNEAERARVGWFSTGTTWIFGQPGGSPKPASDVNGPNDNGYITDVRCYYSDVQTTTKPSSTPTTLPTSEPSSTPTNLIETIKKYNITMKEMSLDSSNFTLTTTYIVSDITSKSQSKITIMDKNCNLTYGGVVADTSVNDTLPVISKGSTLFDGSSLSATFKIDKFSLETSLLTSAVGDVKKSIAGELHFCLKTEIVIGGISLNFRESNFVLEYDLSSNTFSVSENKIEKKAIITSTKSASNIYSIKACRCGKISYGCLTGGEKSQSLNQDSLIHVCLKPNSTDVKISKFYMQFLKHGTNQVDFEPVRNSIGVTGSSVVLGTGTVSVPFKVTSRLITESFANGATKFDIKGDAELQFNSNNRMLNSRSSDRTLQVEAADAGTAPYKMSVNIVGNEISETGYFTTAFSNIVGAGCLVLVFIIVTVIYKKVA